jgi:glycosyltransferase involved in cell wall biosynthesis
VGRMDNRNAIHMGCAAGFGQGGLGGHLRFVQQAAVGAGRRSSVFCRDTPGQSEEFISIPPPKWERWISYTPVRWLPSTKVYYSGIQFDNTVASCIGTEALIYHSFPGFALDTFKKIRRNGGLTIIEAATTHVEELFASTTGEHRRFKMGGSPFSTSWVSRVRDEYAASDFITVASSLQRDSFLSRGVPESKLLFSPLGVDTARFSPADDQASSRKREKREKFRIVQVGQISLLKGFPYLLEAVKSLGDPDIEVLLFGGIGWRSIKEMITEYRKLGLNIKVDAGDPVQALRSAHLCVHASVDDGFGLAPLEAMAVGLPVAVTEHTGMKDAITHGVNGFIVPRRDSEAIARVIQRVKSDEEFRLALGREARARALHYDIHRCVSNYAEVLKPVWG